MVNFMTCIFYHNNKMENKKRFLQDGVCSFKNGNVLL